MTRKFFCLAVMSTALVALGIPAARPVVAGPASVTIMVKSTLDVADITPNDGNCETPLISLAAGACTLRAAVISADAASGEGATIMVPAGIYTLTIPADVTDGANNGDLNLTPPATGDPIINIIGAGAASTIIDGNRQDRVLSVATNRTAVISGVTLRDGLVSSGGVGGGLINRGNLTLDSSIVTSNEAGNSAGGGIYNTNVLTMTNSTIGPSNTAYVGGGIYNDSGTITLDGSTVYGNSASQAAGIFNAGTGGLFLINSTVSQNIAANDAGAIDNQGTINAYNTTIIFNIADTGSPSSTAAGGIDVTIGSTVNLSNTLLAGNYASAAFSNSDCTGFIHSYGWNLFGENPPCSVVLESGDWDVINSLGFIGPLQNNGGPTWTHALLAGSNAIDNGDPSGGCVGPTGPLPTDQRGFPRVAGVRCDIGAYEFLPPVVYLPVVRR